VGFSLRAPPITEALVRAALGFALFPVVAGVALVPRTAALG